MVITVWKTVVIVRVAIFVTGLWDTALKDARQVGGQTCARRVRHIQILTLT